MGIQKALQVQLICYVFLQHSPPSEMFSIVVQQRLSQLSILAILKSIYTKPTLSHDLKICQIVKSYLLKISDEMQIIEGKISLIVYCACCGCVTLEMPWMPRSYNFVLIATCHPFGLDSSVNLNLKRNFLAAVDAVSRRYCCCWLWLLCLQIA